MAPITIPARQNVSNIFNGWRVKIPSGEWEWNQIRPSAKKKTPVPNSFFPRSA
jgi:hypothetical protein